MPFPSYYDSPYYDMYAPLIEDEAEERGLDPNVALNLVGAESGFNPTRVSPRGAQGIMQLMPGTASDLGVDPLDPEASIGAGLDYLEGGLYGGGKESLGYDLPGAPNYQMALAGYNAGPFAVDKAMKKSGLYGPGILPEDIIDFLPSDEKREAFETETIPYVNKIMGTTPRMLPEPPTVRLVGDTGDDVLTGNVKEEDPGVASVERTSRQERIRDLSEEIKGYEEEKESLREDVYRPTRMSFAETLGSIGIPALGVLLGAAFAGKRGALAGVNAGLAGAETSAKSLALEQLEQKKLAAERLADVKQQERDARTELRQQQEGQRDFEERLALKGGVTNVPTSMMKNYNFIKETRGVPAADAWLNEQTGQSTTGAKGKGGGSLPGMEKLSDKAADIITGEVRMAAAGSGVLREIAENYPQYLDESYFGKDGQVDPVKTFGVLKERLKSVVGGSETELGQMQQILGRFIKDYQKQISGTASTDKEYTKLVGLLTTEGVAPLTIPQQIKVIETFLNERKNLALATAEADIRLRGKSENMAQVIEDLFTKAAPPLMNLDQSAYKATRKWTPEDEAAIQEIMDRKRRQQ